MSGFNGQNFSGQTSSSGGGTFGTATTTTTTSNAQPYFGTGQGSAEGVVIPDVTNVSVATRTSPGFPAAIVGRENTEGSFADGTLEFDDVTGAPVAARAGDDVIEYTSGNSVLLSLATSSGGTHEHMHYGLLTQNTGNTHRVAGFHAGTPTLSGLPTSGRATFRGTFIGSHYELGTSQPTPDYVGSIMSMEANFDTGKVTAQIPVILQKGGPGGSYDVKSYELAVDADITGNRFDGTVRYNDGRGTAVGTVTASNASGRFYGPNAAEAGGALRIEGNPDGTPSVIVGGIGVKRYNF